MERHDEIDIKQILGFHPKVRELVDAYLAELHTRHDNHVVDVLSEIGEEYKDDERAQKAFMTGWLMALHLSEAGAIVTEDKEG